MFAPINGDVNYGSVVLHLPMTGANNGTTFTDVSPTPKTVTRYNAVTSTAQSKWGQGSGYFDGNGDYLSLADSNDWHFGTGNFTIESWVYLDGSWASQGNIVNQRPNNTYHGPVWLGIKADRTPRFIVASSESVVLFDIAGSSAISLSAWTHIAAVRNGNAFNLYVNGASVANATDSGSSYDSASTLNIGGDTNTNYFNGYLQDLRITKGIARYTADFAVPAGPLPSRLPELPVRRIQQPNPSYQIARLGL